MIKRIAICGWLICLGSLVSCNDIDYPNIQQNMVRSPVSLQIPVHGFFICPNTPGSRFPSHGIDRYGVEYAIDFVMLEDNATSQKPYRSSFFTYVTRGLPLSDFYGWGRDVYSPVEGVVVQVVDGVEERDPVHVINDLRYAARATRAYNEDSVDAAALLGNSVVIQTERSEYVVLAHLQKDSIVVAVGQRVDASSVIGKLGHSGNSTMPHLHLQAMDRLDFREARGLPIFFSQYYVTRGGKTLDMRDSIPLRGQIMFTAE
ncbi:M23 family metallopeptidase [Candidatus Bipolaricaulota bacterium]|nr:M23 family metallopeptidase [Candidatus Bipolaricaulota bacterium]